MAHLLVNNSTTSSQWQIAGCFHRMVSYQSCTRIVYLWYSHQFCQLPHFGLWPAPIAQSISVFCCECICIHLHTRHCVRPSVLLILRIVTGHRQNRENLHSRMEAGASTVAGFRLRGPIYWYFLKIIQATKLLEYDRLTAQWQLHAKYTNLIYTIPRCRFSAVMQKNWSWYIRKSLLCVVFWSCIRCLGAPRFSPWPFCRSAECFPRPVPAVTLDSAFKHP